MCSRLLQGLYPESHGIVDNTFYDLHWHEQFLRGGSAFDGKWWGGEPVRDVTSCVCDAYWVILFVVQIWLTSKRQGRKSATMFWPGSDSNITGEYPDYCYNYDTCVTRMTSHCRHSY